MPCFATSIFIFLKMLSGFQKSTFLLLNPTCFFTGRLECLEMRSVDEIKLLLNDHHVWTKRGNWVAGPTSCTILPSETGPVTLPFTAIIAGKQHTTVGQGQGLCSKSYRSLQEPLFETTKSFADTPTSLHATANVVVSGRPHEVSSAPVAAGSWKSKSNPDESD